MTQHVEKPAGMLHSIQNSSRCQGGRDGQTGPSFAFPVAEYRNIYADEELFAADVRRSVAVRFIAAPDTWCSLLYVPVTMMRRVIMEEWAGARETVPMGMDWAEMSNMSRRPKVL